MLKIFRGVPVGRHVHVHRSKHSSEWRLANCVDPRRLLHQPPPSAGFLTATVDDPSTSKMDRPLARNSPRSSHRGCTSTSVEKIHPRGRCRCRLAVQFPSLGLSSSPGARMAMLVSAALAVRVSSARPVPGRGRETQLASLS